MWRQIQWNNTLTYALEQSRRVQKPALAWIFTEHPRDERCAVFGGAVREAVFSDPEVVRIVERNFVPVAIKAALFNSPNQLDLLMPASAAKRERLLYDRLRPTAPAQQGLCVMDSTGRPLSWVLAFSDRDAMLRYFPEMLTAYRNSKYAPSKVAERFAQYPNEKLADAYPATSPVAPLPAVPKFSDTLLAKPGRQPGALVVSITGRAVDAQGKPLFDTIHQENYVEDEFTLPKDAQAALSDYLSGSGTRPVALPIALAQQLAAHAFLGPVDVNPVLNPRRAKVDANKWDLRVTRLKSPRKIYQLSGTSRAAISGFNDRDGGNFSNDVTLVWDGFIEFNGRAIKRCAILAQGREKLLWRPEVTSFTSFQELRELNKGRPVKIDSPVVFGFLGGDALAGTAPASIQNANVSSKPGGKKRTRSRGRRHR